MTKTFGTKPFIAEIILSSGDKKEVMAHNLTAIAIKEYPKKCRAQILRVYHQWLKYKIRTDKVYLYLQNKKNV